MSDHEYRLVAERPLWQEGQDLIVPKRNAKKAAEALRDWRRDMVTRYGPNSLDVWEAHIEIREISPWRTYPESDLPALDDS